MGTRQGLWLPCLGYLKSCLSWHIEDGDSILRKKKTQHLQLPQKVLTENQLRPDTHLEAWPDAYNPPSFQAGEMMIVLVSEMHAESPVFCGANAGYRRQCCLHYCLSVQCPLRFKCWGPGLQSVVLFSSWWNLAGGTPSLGWG